LAMPAPPLAAHVEIRLLYTLLLRFHLAILLPLSVSSASTTCSKYGTDFI
jgi:hypothetical protein